jgi:superfamily II DNA or RNA helicase
MGCCVANILLGAEHYGLRNKLVLSRLSKKDCLPLKADKDRYKLAAEITFNSLEANKVLSDSYLEQIFYRQVVRAEFDPQIFLPQNIIKKLSSFIDGKKIKLHLVEKGILAKPKIYFIRCDRGDDQTVVWENSGRDYANLYKQEIVDNEYRNALIVKICSIKKNKKIIVLHEIIEHGETLLKTFEKLLPNRKIHLLSGKDNVKTRSDIIDIFEKSGNDIIIASKIFNVGVNVVTVDVVINTSASKGEISALQKLGRGLRTTKDKDTMEYWDILDENSRVFQRQAKRRIAIYKKEGINNE